jgi:F-type H+-transporting ATPase subunit a
MTTTLAVRLLSQAEEGHEQAHEFPNLLTFVREFLGDSPLSHFLAQWETMFFSLLTVAILVGVTRAASRRAKLVPGPLQNFVEWAVEGLYNLVTGVLGPRGKQYFPFLGTLFVYILFMNYLGLVPLMKSPTSVFNQTFALAICVFLYVQYSGIRNLGLLGYLRHLAGDPQDALGWGLAILMFPLHLMGELVKPVSLSMRLFGNIMGEDILLFMFAGLGITVLGPVSKFLHVGIPVHLPFIFLALLMSLIQALVFMLLATVYFQNFLPHEEGEEH